MRQPTRRQWRTIWLTAVTASLVWVLGGSLILADIRGDAKLVLDPSARLAVSIVILGLLRVWRLAGVPDEERIFSPAARRRLRVAGMATAALLVLGSSLYLYMERMVELTHRPKVTLADLVPIPREPRRTAGLSLDDFEDFNPADYHKVGPATDEDFNPADHEYIPEEPTPTPPLPKKPR